MVRLLSAGTTHLGRLRANNEDEYIAMPEAGVFAVSDGMGGEAAGEIASRYFIETIQALFAKNSFTSEAVIAASVENVFKYSNKRILEDAEENRGHRGMGCTGDLLVFWDTRYIIGHVGDSRVYLLRNGKLGQLTKDQSLVQRWVDEGLLTIEDARHHPSKNIILQAIGTQPVLSCDIQIGNPRHHDIFLLCSDGLTDMVEDSEIQRILCANGSLQQKAGDLIEAALDAGGRDNVTVVLCEVETSS